jgi:hypothetical protein
MFQDRIDVGIRALDTHIGPGWENDIDLGTLSLTSMRLCVLGQLGRITSRSLGLSCLAEGGFNVTPEESATATWDNNPFDNLRTAWVESILSLRAANRCKVPDVQYA